MHIFFINCSIKLCLLHYAPIPQDRPPSLFCNLVSKVNLRGLFLSTHSCICTQEDNPDTLPPTIFAVTKQQRHKEGVRQLTLPILSHRPNVCLCAKLCVIPMPRLTRRSREDKLLNEEQGPRHLFCPLPFSPSPFFLSTH